MEIEFVVPGRPIPQARPRVTGNGRHTYTPRRSVEYRQAVALCARSAMRGKEILTGAVSVRVRFVFAVPTSWRKEKRTEAACGRLAHLSRPDIDNLYKAVTDACTGIVYADDAQIVEAKISHGYAGRLPEGAYVTVEETGQWTRKKYP